MRVHPPAIVFTPRLCLAHCTMCSQANGSARNVAPFRGSRQPPPDYRNAVPPDPVPLLPIGKREGLIQGSLQTRRLASAKIRALAMIRAPAAPGEEAATAGRILLVFPQADGPTGSVVSGRSDCWGDPVRQSDAAISRRPSCTGRCSLKEVTRDNGSGSARFHGFRAARHLPDGGSCGSGQWQRGPFCDRCRRDADEANPEE